MKAECYDPPLRWLITSQKFGESKKYLVDLSENNGIGRCDCSHFRCRLDAAIKIGKPVEECRCKHIRLAMQELAESVIRVTIKSERYATRHS